MKKKLTKIFGVGLTLSLLATLLIGALPVSAGILFWDKVTIPSTSGNQLAPVGSNLDILDLAVNGDTMYAACGTIGVYKSTDGGQTWSSLNGTTSYPASVNATKVVVATDSASILLFIHETGVTQTMYYSDNGGSSWSNLTNPTGATAIADVDLSVLAGGYRYIAAAAQNGTDGHLYALRLGLADTWKDLGHLDAAGNVIAGFSPNYTPVDSMLAVKISPNFATDKVIACVGANVTAPNTHTIFQVFRYELGAYTWNNAITFFQTSGYGNGVMVRPSGSGGSAIGATVAAVTTADLALVPTYLGTRDTERIAFVSLGNAGGEGGAFRLTDNFVKEITTWSGGNAGALNSIAYSAKGKLVAGGLLNNNVLRCLTPLASSPACERITPYKSPGGASAVVVAFSGDKVVAGTRGNESAFSVSTNDGMSFNDISLIDTALDNISDTTIASDGKSMYLASVQASTDTSFWFMEGGKWMRVLSLPGRTTASATIRAVGADFTNVFIFFAGTQDIFQSLGSGKVTWNYVPCYKVSAITSVAVQDANTIHVIDASVYTKSTNAGASFSDTVSMDGITASSISLAGNDIIVSGTGGYIAFSKDGGATWTKITNTVGGGTGTVLATTDSAYATNGIIYATLSTVAGTNIYRGVLGKDMTWDLRGPPILANETFKGFGKSGTVLYFFSTDSTTNTTYEWRALAPTAASADLMLWSGTAVSGIFKSFKVSGGPTIYATKTATTVALSPMEVWSYGDPIATAAPKLNSPATGYVINVNPKSGDPYSITFSFDRYDSPYITRMQLQIATDSAFAGIFLDSAGSGNIVVTQTTTAYTVSGAVLGSALFNPGTTYYWRIRVAANGPQYSPWSESRSFTVANIRDRLVSIQAPANGIQNSPLVPNFAWTPSEGAVAYEWQIAKDAAFTVPGWSYVGDNALTNNAYMAEHELDYSATYYWRVRPVFVKATAKVKGEFGEWAVGVFTVMAKPVTPTPTPTPTPTIINPPPPIPTYLLWLIIGIGAVLFIALIVLIVRTRKVA